MTPRYNQQSFTPAIQAFISEMRSWPWWSKFSAALFIRDFRELPVSSPHDIDLMMDSALQPTFLDLMQKKGREANLYCFHRLSATACTIILFDLSAISNGRAWVFFEIRDSIRVTRSRVLGAADIDIEMHPVSGLPVPSTPWQAFLEIFQGVRTGDIGKAEHVLDAAGIDPNGAGSIFRSILGLDLWFAERLSKCATELNQVAELIVVRSRKQTEKPKRLTLTRLNRFLFRNFYFYHRPRPLFFTIHGPDGVGKTTTCSEIEKILRRLPLPFVSFHHITSWKSRILESGIASVDRSRSYEGNAQRASLLHLILRWAYRQLPENIQGVYVLVQGYDMYLGKLNKIIYTEYCRDRIIFVDRYLYDLVAKNIIKGNGWLWIHHLFVTLARRPTRAFVLTDDAAAIYRRKQELTVTEIETYQALILKLTNHRHIATETLSVAGRSPANLARAIAEKILDDCNAAILVYMRKYSKDYEASNA
jgi:thymidylate kinase